eukprot:4997112-Amphidinium_carterae.1
MPMLHRHQHPSAQHSPLRHAQAKHVWYGTSNSARTIAKLSFSQCILHKLAELHATTALEATAQTTAKP